jgi:hypothetical protein
MVKGLDLPDMKTKLLDRLTRHHMPYYLEMDFSRFDAHQSQEALRAVEC